MSRSQSLFLPQLPLVRRVVFTGALCMLGLGYLFAGIFIFQSHHGRDGDPMLSVEDIAIAYAGSKEGTKIESALRGPMSNMLPANENLEIVAWVRAGAGQEEYESKMKAIFDNRCIACHNNNNPHLPSLEDYEGVTHVAQQDTGFNVHTLVRVSHIHMFGLSFIFFITAFIFSHAYFRNVWLQSAIIAIPFLSIAVDIGSWYITKMIETFAWAVLISGSVMGTCFGIMVCVSLYQMWFYELPEDVK